MPAVFNVQGRQFSFSWVAVWLVAEVLVFLAIVDRYGFLMAVLAQVASAALGISLLRWHGRNTLQMFGQPNGASNRPEQYLAQAAIGALGAVLFIVPGFLSSIVAILLIVPAFRHYAAKAFGKMLPVFPRSAASSQPNTVDLDPTEWANASPSASDENKRLR